VHRIQFLKSTLTEANGLFLDGDGELLQSRKNQSNNESSIYLDALESKGGVKRLQRQQLNGGHGCESSPAAKQKKAGVTKNWFYCREDKDIFKQ
jgi:hypothetical protein